LVILALVPITNSTNYKFYSDSTKLSPNSPQVLPIFAIPVQPFSSSCFISIYNLLK